MSKKAILGPYWLCLAHTIVEIPEYVHCAALYVGERGGIGVSIGASRVKKPSPAVLTRHGQPSKLTEIVIGFVCNILALKNVDLL